LSWLHAIELGPVSVVVGGLAVGGLVEGAAELGGGAVEVLPDFDAGDADLDGRVVDVVVVVGGTVVDVVVVVGGSAQSWVSVAWSELSVDCAVPTPFCAAEIAWPSPPASSLSSCSSPDNVCWSPVTICCAWATVWALAPDGAAIVKDPP